LDRTGWVAIKKLAVARMSPPTTNRRLMTVKRIR
jgi:hypothetical protein